MSHYLYFVNFLKVNDIFILFGVTFKECILLVKLVKHGQIVNRKRRYKRFAGVGVSFKCTLV